MDDGGGIYEINVANMDSDKSLTFGMRLEKTTVFPEPTGRETA